MSPLIPIAIVLSTLAFMLGHASAASLPSRRRRSPRLKNKNNYRKYRR